MSGSAPQAVPTAQVNISRGHKLSAATAEMDPHTIRTADFTADALDVRIGFPSTILLLLRRWCEARILFHFEFRFLPCQTLLHP